MHSIQSIFGVLLGALVTFFAITFRPTPELEFYRNPNITEVRFSMPKSRFASTIETAKSLGFQQVNADPLMSSAECSYERHYNLKTSDALIACVGDETVTVYFQRNSVSNGF